ncbi:hypothetical protein V7799_21915 [Rhizobium laguerreae]
MQVSEKSITQMGVQATREPTFFGVYCLAFDFTQFPDAKARHSFAEIASALGVDVDARPPSMTETEDAMARGETPGALSWSAGSPPSVILGLDPRIHTASNAGP